jgi:AcrR family transcriptional regulator
MSVDFLADENPNIDAILQAARSCITARGYKNLSMEAIAEKCRLSRRTLYRAFASKDELLARLLYEHCQEKIARLKFNSGHFQRAFIDGATRAIPLIQQDPIMMELMYRGGAEWYQRQMLDYDSPVYRCVLHINLGFWDELLNRGKNQGLVNPDLSNEEIIRWYTNIQYMMIVRVNATMEENRRIMEKFFLPSIRP